MPSRPTKRKKIDVEKMMVAAKAAAPKPKIAFDPAEVTSISVHLNGRWRTAATDADI